VKRLKIAVPVTDILKF